MGQTAVGVGMGLTSFSLSKTEADANLDSAKYTEQQLRTNAHFSKLQAEDAIKRGDQEANELQKQTNSLIGTQRVGYATQGIDVESGSALEVQMDTAAQSALAQMSIKNNAWREAWGYRVEAEGMYGQADMTRLAGKQAHRTGVLTGLFNAVAIGMNTSQRMSTAQNSDTYGGASAKEGRATSLGRKVPSTYANGQKYTLSNSKTGWMKG